MCLICIHLLQCPHQQTTHPHDAIHAFCHLLVKTRNYLRKEHLFKVPDPIECEHLPPPDSLKCFWRRLPVEKWIFNLWGADLVDIPQVSMLIACPLKMYICGIVLWNKTAHFRVLYKFLTFLKCFSGHLKHFFGVRVLLNDHQRAASTWVMWQQTFCSRPQEKWRWLGGHDRHRWVDKFNWDTKRKPLHFSSKIQCSLTV